MINVKKYSRDSRKVTGGKNMGLMKVIQKSLVFCILAVTLVFSTNAYAADVGMQLTSPVPGWQRIDDNDSRLSFPNGKKLIQKPIGYYDNTLSLFDDSIGNPKNTYAVSFKFKGTKIRVYAYRGPDRATDSKISIDGSTATMPALRGAYQQQTLIYEKTGLTDGVHTVEMTSGTDGSYSNFILDAIDIDESGYIVVPLPSPEPGWKRTDDTDSRLSFPNSRNSVEQTGSYNNTLSLFDESNRNPKNTSAVSFCFKGTKIRVYAYRGPDRATDSKISIDGSTATMPALRGAYQHQTLIYEKTGLTDQVHTVNIISGTDGSYSNFMLDAIDIDESGYICIN